MICTIIMEFMGLSRVCMGSIHMRQFGDHRRVVLLDILKRRQVVQSTMGTDFIVDSFPFFKHVIECWRGKVNRIS